MSALYADRTNQFLFRPKKKKIVHDYCILHPYTELEFPFTFTFMFYTLYIYALFSMWLFTYIFLRLFFFYSGNSDSTSNNIFTKPLNIFFRNVEICLQ